MVSRDVLLKALANGIGIGSGIGSDNDSELLREKNYRISTDSRTYQRRELFIALQGEKNDGFDYVGDVLDRGCQVVVFNASEGNLRKRETFKERAHFIAVKDTLTYLQRVSHLHVKQWLAKNPNRKVIGITGSNGKTTSKEMLFHYLNSVMPQKTHCSYGNYNNHIGVPLTLVSLEEWHDMAIVEMGTNHPGEIKSLCEIACPNAGMITNIGKAHLEFFKNETAVFEEKRVLFDYVFQNRISDVPFVVSGDDKFLHTLLGATMYGEYAGDLRILLASGQVTIRREGKKDYAIVLNNKHIMGKHNLKNLAGTFILASLLCPADDSDDSDDSKDILAQAASTFKPKDNRSVWIKQEGVQIFLDAYNANPSSMEASLRSFFDHCQHQKIPLEDCFFVLGDMNELGSQAEKYHREVGHLLARLGGVNVCFIGRYRESYAKGYQRESLAFPSKEKFSHVWPGLKEKFNIFFLKGSRSLQLESLVE